MIKQYDEIANKSLLYKPSKVRQEIETRRLNEIDYLKKDNSTEARHMHFHKDLKRYKELVKGLQNNEDTLEKFNLRWIKENSRLVGTIDNILKELPDISKENSISDRINQTYSGDDFNNTGPTIR